MSCRISYERAHKKRIIQFMCDRPVGVNPTRDMLGRGVVTWDVVLFRIDGVVFGG